MPLTEREVEAFDSRLARECALAFSRSTGLDCTVSNASGKIICEETNWSPIPNHSDEC